MKISIDWFFADTFENCKEGQRLLQQPLEREGKKFYGLYIWFDTESKCPIYVGGTSRPFAKRFAEHWNQHLNGRYSIHCKPPGMSMKEGIIKYFILQNSFEEAEKFGAFERVLPSDDLNGRFNRGAILRRYETLEAMSFACGLVEVVANFDYRAVEGKLNLAAKASFLELGQKAKQLPNFWADLCGRVSKLPPGEMELIHEGSVASIVCDVLNLRV